MKITQLITLLLLSVAVLFTGCGGDGGQKSASESSSKKEESGLSDFEMEHGIGPVTEVVELGSLDMELAEKGREIFELKCSACHKVNERYIGPAVGDVLERRSATYVMNMILNPDGMVKEHPEARKVLQEYLSPMPNQGLNKDEARAIVEFFASDLE